MYSTYYRSSWSLSQRFDITRISSGMAGEGWDLGFVTLQSATIFLLSADRSRSAQEGLFQQIGSVTNGVPVPNSRSDKFSLGSDSFPFLLLLELE